MTITRNWASLVVASLFLLPTAPAWSVCYDDGVHVQVLGSGGPRASSGRASAAYVVWVDGESRIMIDAGGGTKNNFYEAGADLGEVGLIALSHLHPDHSAELPAILWPAGGDYHVVGPSGDGVFPSIGSWLDQLMGPEGAFAVLDERVNFDVTEVAHNPDSATVVWDQEPLRVSAISVPHANVPTLGYRVEYDSDTIVFASDQNGSNPAFIEFAKEADYLVIHLAGSETSTGAISQLHAKPSVWGQMAADAGVEHVIVSHIATSSAEELEQSLAVVREHYDGDMTVAEDLMCFELD